jgi:hypothetical protein
MSTRTSDATLSGSVADDAAAGHDDAEECRGYYIFPYQFWMTFDGLLAKYELKCSIADLVVKGERSMTPIYGPGTC